MKILLLMLLAGCRLQVVDCPNGNVACANRAFRDGRGVRVRDAHGRAVALIRSTTEIDDFYIGERKQ